MRRGRGAQEHEQVVEIWQLVEAESVVSGKSAVEASLSPREPQR